MTKLLKKWVHIILGCINKLLPKYDRVYISGAPNTDSNAIAVANYISSNYEMPVYYVISNKHTDDPRGLLSPDIKFINHYRSLWRNVHCMLKFMTSKYVFITQTPLVYGFSGRQTVTNIWHGVLYKKVGLLTGNYPIKADITAGTSQSTRKMFSEAFGVAEDSVLVSGYPRNDMLVNAKNEKSSLKKRIDNLCSFKKNAIWMPTFRKLAGSNRKDGVEVGNPFYIKDFNISYFNELLRKNDTLCLVKPHPGAPLYDDQQNLSHVRFIDDDWIARQGITLYQLLGCTDMLISDVSSVIIDYLLVDHPVICVSTDFDAYKKTRGFYFKDIENWIPSRINKTQQAFFNHLEDVLEHGADPYRQKREKLKNYFFDHYDAKSTARIVDFAIKNKTTGNIS